MCDGAKCKGELVRFGTISVFFHDLTIGDNPSVQHGPPIQLSWKADSHVVLDLEEFEILRGQHRVGAVVKIPRLDRIRILKGFGHSMSDINRASKDATISRNRRRATAMNKSPIEKQEKREEIINSLTCKKEEASIDFVPTSVKGCSLQPALKKPGPADLDVLQNFQSHKHELTVKLNQGICRKCLMAHLMNNEKASKLPSHSASDCKYQGHKRLSLFERLSSWVVEEIESREDEVSPSGAVLVNSEIRLRRFSLDCETASQLSSINFVIGSNDGD